MICPDCTTQNQDHFKFCRECGRRLAPPVPSAGGERTIAASFSAATPAVRLDEAEQAARLLEQAFDQYDAGQYEDAVSLCHAAQALDPTSSAPHSLLGMIYERMGKTSDAVRQYQLVLQMSPDSIADATRLDSLLSRKDGTWVPAFLSTLTTRPRLPLLAGAAATVVVLLMGFWVSRAVGQSPRERRTSARAPSGPIPGASMARPNPSALPMPGAAQPLPGQGFAAAPTTTVPGSSLPTGGARPIARVPSPPTNAWPGLRGGYPQSAPAGRAPQTAASPMPGVVPPYARRDLHRSVQGYPHGYLAPAPIQGVEKLGPNGATAGLSPMPGASLPTFPGAVPQRPFERRPAGSGTPVLPPVATAQPPAQPAPPPAVTAPPAAVPEPPPSASITIQPLDEESADETQGERQSSNRRPDGVRLSHAQQGP
jgi:hypothetical protein